MRIATFIGLATLALLSAPARAWNAAGHRLVALLAYERLDPAVRTEYVSLLRQHPRFAEDFLAAMPGSVRDARDEQVRERWIFARAAVWPDVARGFEEPELERYHRATWHYTNGVLFLSQADADHFGGAVDGNRALRWTPGEDEGVLNIVQALDRAERRLVQDATPAAEKAVLLCWVLHLIGDLHQPLHAASLYSARGFPTGDRGGNDVRLSGGRWNLHAFWDSALASDDNPEALEARVAHMLGAPRFASLAAEAARTRDRNVWRQESYDAAWLEAYAESVLTEIERQEGRLEAGQSFEDGTAPFSLPLAYRVRVYDVARRRAVEAGARLAARLGELALK